MRSSRVLTAITVAFAACFGWASSEAAAQNTTQPQTAADAPTVPPATDGTDADNGTDNDDERQGSLVSNRPLGSAEVGMTLGGGVAVLLPYYAMGVGVGLSEEVDIVGRFETVLGVLHYPHLGVRWNFAELGPFELGAQLAVHYSFFGIKTDRVNLTSTFYSSAHLGATAAITESSDLFVGATAEIDYFEYDVVDDEGQIEGGVRYDATILRGGMVTAFTDDFDGYALARVRIPTESLTVDAQDLYLVPLLEIGGSWTF